MPTKMEIEILKVSWREGELSAREIHDLLKDKLGWSASTNRTILDRMVEKGLLKTRSVHRLKIYAASAPKTSFLATMINDYLGRVLEIDGPIPVSSFTGSKILTEDELTELEAHFLEQSQKAEE